MRGQRGEASMLSPLRGSEEHGMFPVILDQEVVVGGPLFGRHKRG